MKVTGLSKSRRSSATTAEAGNVAISCRVRLARNLKEAVFPTWADEQECIRVGAILRDACSKLTSIEGPVFFDMAGTPPVDKEILRERHLISTEMTATGPGSGLLVSGNESVAIMINEEDHLRIQAIRPGTDLLGAWEDANRVDTELEGLVEYAFSAKLGYLTSCPTNAGTGLRASAMLHLSGLRLMEEIEPVIRGLDKLDMAVRGLWGEGTDAFGNMFQISNQSTMGETEVQILERLGAVVAELIRHEENARMRLKAARRTFLMDEIGRALGILLNARLLPSREAVNLLSAIGLGAELGVIKNITSSDIGSIMLLTQPGHLQKMEKRVIETEERDEVRASIVRARLKGVRLHG